MKCIAGYDLPDSGPCPKCGHEWNEGCGEQKIFYSLISDPELCEPKENGFEKGEIGTITPHMEIK